MRYQCTARHRVIISQACFGSLLIVLGLLTGTTRAGDELARLPEAVDIATLDTQRARQRVGTLQFSQINEYAQVQDNQVIGGHSGNNLISEGAFDNVRGIATVIQNTGHNVAIQESMILNIVINP